MNYILFENVMSAVDNDLLEEAQRPVKTHNAAKTKRNRIALALSAAACLAVIATASLRTAEPENPGSTMITNPLQTVSAGDIEELGFRLPLPDDAQEPSYFLINLGAEQTSQMAEVRFRLNDGEYTCRTKQTESSEDISGIYADWDQSYYWTADSLELSVMEAEDNTACVSWYEAGSGTQWSLSGNQGASEALNTAGAILNTLGYDLNVAPEGAEKCSFSALRQDGLTVGETKFVLDGITFRYRIAATKLIEEDFADISGIDGDFAEETLGEIGWCSARICYNENEGGKILWFDPAPGLLYSLYMESGASEEALLDMANMLYAPAQDDVG